MKIGISLPPEYLAGKPHSEWTPVFGDIDQGLEMMKANGVESIELRAVAACSDPVLILAALDKIRQFGLQASVHGCLTVSMTERPGLPLPVLQALSQRGERVVVTVHCLSSEKEDIAQLSERTEQVIRRWLQWIDANECPITLALELNRAKGIVDPGTDYANLVALQKRIQHPRLGFCWDFGHTANNMRQKLLPQDAPEEFLQQVVHTHIHDLGPNEQTHWPLTCGITPVARWVKALSMAGYTGVLNLEVNPARFAGTIAMSSQDAIFHSLALLQAARSAITSRCVQ